MISRWLTIIHFIVEVHNFIITVIWHIIDITDILSPVKGLILQAMKAIKPLIWPTYFEPVLNWVEISFDDLLWSKVLGSHSSLCKKLPMQWKTDHFDPLSATDE